MSNPFKKGDKVVRKEHSLFAGDWEGDTGVFTVCKVNPSMLTLCELDEDFTYGCHHFRAAIAGQDYPLPVDGLDAFIAANSGHLSDGSSVQKHSAGPLYPCVLTFRDARLNGRVWNEDLKAHVKAKYDVGIISPRNSEPLWFSTFDRAVSVAATIKEDLQ